MKTSLTKIEKPEKMSLHEYITTLVDIAILPYLRKTNNDN